MREEAAWNLQSKIFQQQCSGSPTRRVCIILIYVLNMQAFGPKYCYSFQDQSSGNCQDSWLQNVAQGICSSSIIMWGTSDVVPNCYCSSTSCFKHHCPSFPTNFKQCFICAPSNRQQVVLSFDPRMWIFKQYFFNTKEMQWENQSLM